MKVVRLKVERIGVRKQPRKALGDFFARVFVYPNIDLRSFHAPKLRPQILFVQERILANITPMNQAKNWILGVLAIFVVGAIVLLTKPQSEVEVGAPVEEAEESGPTITPITPEGLFAQIKADAPKIAVVNFWASFCQPCRDEFPYFVRALREYRDEGLKVYFVSMDFESEVDEARSFLVEQGVDFESYIKDLPDQEFIDGIHKEWSGTIPVTLFLNEKAEVISFVPRAMEFEELEEKILEILKK